MAVTVSTGEMTRERVLRSADALFAEHGYAAVSMRELASAVGVTKPALYYHFRDKETLYEECVLADQARQGVLLRQALESTGTLEERVEKAAYTLLTAAHDHSVRTRADIVEHLSRAAHERLAASYRRSVTDPLGELFAEAARQRRLRSGIDPRTCPAVLLGLVHSCWHPLPGRDAGRRDADGAWPGSMPDLAPEDAARLVADIVLRWVAVVVASGDG